MKVAGNVVQPPRNDSTVYLNVYIVVITMNWYCTLSDLVH